MITAEGEFPLAQLPEASATVVKRLKGYPPLPSQSSGATWYCSQVTPVNKACHVNLNICFLAEQVQAALLNAFRCLQNNVLCDWPKIT